ncbi:hypothetical protein [Rubrobacter tropicus]|nr:hypothetical protein [Rubrobacter tropicus]
MIFSFTAIPGKFEVVNHRTVPTARRTPAPAPWLFVVGMKTLLPIHLA